MGSEQEQEEHGISNLLEGYRDSIASCLGIRSRRAGNAGEIMLMEKSSFYLIKK